MPRELVEDLSLQVAQWPTATVLTNDQGQELPPWTLDRLVRRARAAVPDLPVEFRFHDLRHWFGSLLIASGSDVKVVQRRRRHSSAKTTLDTFSPLWPDSDDSTRAAVEAVLSARAEARADCARTADGGSR